MQPGYGTVESIKPVIVVSPKAAARERSAAAGGTAKAGEAGGTPMYRVAVRMADGSVQLRDIDKPEVKVGEDVLLTNAGDVVPDKR